MILLRRVGLLLLLLCVLVFRTGEREALVVVVVSAFVWCETETRE